MDYKGEKMVKIKVPASTANIGPGFDTLGLALNLYNIYEFEEIENGLIIEGCPEEYQNENNLVYKSFMVVAKDLNKEIKGLKIKMKTNIPVSRGLGSSSACIVGGVFGANFLLDGDLSKDELYKTAVRIEGHPDNITPAVFGGLTASLVEDGMPYYVNYDIDSNVRFCALIPDFETSTAEARKLLPEKVPYKDAIFNVSRTAVLLKAFENADFDLIKIALKDRLHQQYRKTLIHEFDEVEKICLNNESISVFVSGSGPTVMNIIQSDEFGNIIKEDLKSLKYNWKVIELNADKNGTIVEILKS